MVRLYPFPRDGEKTALCPLHSIMVRLYLDRAQLAAPHSRFTFHYGEIISAIPNNIWSRGNSLYIPLWWDYIYGYKWNESHFQCLYIPLWWDYIATESDLLERFDAFTFHYGEIISVGRRTAGVNPRPFTFHYGEIISAISPSASAFVFALHSIMVRLYPVTAPAPGAGTSFTFHYGEIISKSAYCSIHVRPAFTFHYGEIISSSRLSKETTAINLYIPLWWDYIYESCDIHRRLGSLYIPLWWDYINVTSVSEAPLLSLYIPLWWDYIKNRALTLRPWFSFTFHYGEIISRGRCHDARQ